MYHIYCCLLRCAEIYETLPMTRILHLRRSWLHRRLFTVILHANHTTALHFENVSSADCGLCDEGRAIARVRYSPYYYYLAAVETLIFGSLVGLFVPNIYTYICVCVRKHTSPRGLEPPQLSCHRLPPPPQTQQMARVLDFPKFRITIYACALSGFTAG